MLQWHLRHGKHLEWFFSLEENGTQVRALDDMPTLYPDLAGSWKAFWDLSGSRSVGLAIGPIPFSEIAAYCTFYGITGESANRLIRHVQILDMTFLEHHKPPDKTKR